MRSLWVLALVLCLLSGASAFNTRPSAKSKTSGSTVRSSTPVKTETLGTNPPVVEESIEYRLEYSLSESEEDNWIKFSTLTLLVSRGKSGQDVIKASLSQRKRSITFSKLENIVSNGGWLRIRLVGDNQSHHPTAAAKLVCGIYMSLFLNIFMVV